jgi:hypothetical protein
MVGISPGVTLSFAVVYVRGAPLGNGLRQIAVQGMDKYRFAAHLKVGSFHVVAKCLLY